MKIETAHQYKIRLEKELSEKNNLEFDTTKANLKNTIVKQISYNSAKEIIIKYEWLKTMPLFSKYYFGLFFIIDNKEYLGGVVVYSDEYSANKQNVWGKYGFYNKIILLSRGVCLWWTPKNSASYLISKTYDWLKTNTNYKVVTATVDPAAGEIGTIYQSLNWYYVGLMTGNYNTNGNETKRFSVLINGKLRYSRSIRKELGTMKKDVILKKYPNAIFIPQYRKRRYFYFIGNKSENKFLKKQIDHLIIPYPKRGIEMCGIIYKITNLINNKIYIGQTTRPFHYRISEYENRIGCNQYLARSFDKYGFNNFKFEILDSSETLDELNEKEIYYINKYNSRDRDNGYNIEYGGKNSIVSEETRKKLSDARKNIKQNKEWIEKRLESVNKKVIKIDLRTNEILDEFTSLANASRENSDNLSYSQINRMCLGLVKNVNSYRYCYQDDFIKNQIPQYNKKTEIREFNTLSEYELKKIKKEYDELVPIREIANKYNIHFSTLSNFLKKHIDKELSYSDNMIAICKKTKKIFTDFKNSSGCITTHLKEVYDSILIESNYKRKKIEKDTGKFWYDKYFDFKEKKG